MNAPLAPGTLLHNRYRILGVAGQGPFGQTYLAHDEKRSDECVLKEFGLPALPDPHDWEQFQAIVSVLYRLQHPQLPRHQVCFLEGDRLYWAREYVPGESYSNLLHDRVAAGAAFSELEVTQLLEQLLPVLTYLHSQGIIHQNISPDSIILRERDRLPVLINYGLVKEQVAQLQGQPAGVASHGAMPPEQRTLGKLYPSSDLYALAAVAIALLTGKPVAALYDETTQRLRWDRSAIDPALSRLLRQLLHSHPPKRLASATLVLQALRSQRQSRSRAKPIPAQRDIKRDRRAVPDPSSSAALAIGVVLLMAVLAVRVASFVQEPKLESPPATVKSPVPTPALPGPLPVPTPPPPPSSPEAAVQLESFQTIATQPLRDRRSKSEIDTLFLINLTNEVFYSKNPQKPKDEAERGKLRSEWNAIASMLLDKLDTLTADSRRKLGSYRRATYDQWLKELGDAGISSQTLDTQTDRRFFDLFPEQKGKLQNPRTFGQIWYAIAQEQTTTAKAQKPTSK